MSEYVYKRYFSLAIENFSMMACVKMERIV